MRPCHAEEVRLLLRGHLAVEAIEHELRVADDRVHRRAELVAHRGEELALEAVRAFELQVVDAQLADEVGVLVRDRDQTGDRAQSPRLGVGELALIVEVRGEKSDRAAARGERNVRDESQLARRNGRETNAVGVRLGADQHAHGERHRRLGIDADGRRRRETST